MYQENSYKFANRNFKDRKYLHEESQLKKNPNKLTERQCNYIKNPQQPQ